MSLESPSVSHLWTVALKIQRRDEQKHPSQRPHILLYLFFNPKVFAFFPSWAFSIDSHETTLLKNQTFGPAVLEKKKKKKPLEFGLRISAGFGMLNQLYCDKWKDHLWLRKITCNFLEPSWLQKKALCLLNRVQGPRGRVESATLLSVRKIRLTGRLEAEDAERRKGQSRNK